MRPRKSDPGKSLPPISLAKSGHEDSALEEQTVLVGWI